MKTKTILGISAVMAAILTFPTNLKPTFGGTKPLSEELFQRSSMDFNPDIARLCLELSIAARGDTSDNVKKFLKELGFAKGSIRDFNSYENTANNAADSVAYAFAHKTIKNGSRACHLVAIVIRGTSGDNEWSSNFNVNNSKLSPSVHEGFNKAKTDLLTDLTAYAKKLHLKKDNTKFLITGHSRGAAVANLLAAGLCKNETLATQSNIYAYTFATPNVAKLGDENYLNIFNAVNPVDIITQMPLADWGYGKYGVNYDLPEISAIKPSALEATEKFSAQIASMAPTLTDFYDSEVTFLFLKGDSMPPETAEAHHSASYMNCLNAVNPKALTEQVGKLQMALLGGKTDLPA